MGALDPEAESEHTQAADESADEQFNETPDDSLVQVPVSRRGALATLIGLGGLSLASDQATANHTGPHWNMDVDAGGQTLYDLGALAMRDNTTDITDFEGTNLSIVNGVLNATVTDTDTHTLVSDSDGSPSDEEANDIEFGTNLDLTGSGGSYTVDSLAEANTGSNLGSGSPVFAGKSGVDLAFRSLTAGNNVALSASGSEIQISATDTDTDTRTNISDDGTQVVTDTADINFAANLDVTDDGDGSVTVAGSSVSLWSDDDSDTLLEASGFGGIDVDFVKTPRLGTTDTTAFEGVVDDERFLRVVPTALGHAPNIIAGHPSNSGPSGVVGATIAGGGNTNNPNTVTGSYGTVGGGGGNDATGALATIGGGSANDATGGSATVGGGTGNDASADRATVGGGSGNHASGEAATIPGGRNNLASGEYSFAAGRLATTETSGGTVHDGAVVFGDSSTNTVRSQHPNQFVVQSGGGAIIYSSSSLSTGVTLPSGGGSWSSLSARAAKTNVQSVDSRDVLEKVDGLDISSWEYDSDEDATHIGPMAEDFYDAFELGDSEKRIATVDADGVAFAAIQGLSAKLDDKDGRISNLETENEQLRSRLNAVEDRLASLEGEQVSPAAADD